MKFLIVLCAVVAVSQAGYLGGGIAAYGAYGAPAALAAPGLLAGPYAGHGLALGHAGLAAPALAAYAAPAVVVPHAQPYAATLSAGGPAGYTALSAAGTPIETPAVQAGRITDAVAHATAKTHAYLG